MKTPVVIVGAGPTGLVLALWLKRRGIDFRILDKSSGPGQTSRALAVQARILEFYKQLGLADALVERGITAREIILRRRGKAVARAKVGEIGKNLTPYPFLLFCSQDVHEEMLCDELKKLGVHVERQTELVGLEQTSAAVTMKLRTPKGEETVEAEYVCGCDGAHSAVRQLLNIDFPGGTYSQLFFVADVQGEGEAAAGGVQISVSKEDFCIVMPIKQKDSIRLTGLVPSESETKDAVTFDDVSESVRRNTGFRVDKVNWFSSYHVHHRVAPHFRTGRVFLSGDAAHIHSPAGGQGMNTGIGDAINLAWKLADVIQGHAPEKLLESYEPERMAFARVLVATTDTVFRIIASRSFVGRIFRAYILPRVFATLVRFQWFLRFAFRALSQTRIQYRSSALSAGADSENAVQAGDRLPWISFGVTDNFSPLKTLDWQIHVYGTLRVDMRALADRRKIPFHEFAWNANAQSKGIEKDMLYVVRPDGHIGLKNARQNAMVLESYLDQWHRSVN